MLENVVELPVMTANCVELCIKRTQLSAKFESNNKYLEKISYDVGICIYRVYHDFRA
jgi:hypothetical protein